MKSDLLRRRLYLFSERIGIRQSELALLLALVAVTLTAGLVSGFWPSPQAPFSEADYAALKAEFHARSARALREDSIRTAKFHFPEAYLAAETAETDSSMNNSAESVKKSSKKESGIVNINTATLAELERIPGVGPKTAEAILALRQKNGPFTSVEQLSAVKGIGPKKLEKLKPHVTF